MNGVAVYLEGGGDTAQQKADLRQGMDAFTADQLGEPGSRLADVLREGIGQADIVFADRLVGKGVMALVARGAEVVNVGKSKGEHSVPQSEIHERMIAAARILMPASMVRLSAGRLSLSDEAQALCFLAGANSIFMGERLLTTPNPEADSDRRLFDKLGMRLMTAEAEDKVHA